MTTEDESYLLRIKGKQTMKLEFKTKYLQYLSSKNGNQGFSWVELLFIIMIFGFLVAIVLPSLFGQTVKPKPSEAKNNIGTLNRAQQAYFLEYQRFTTDMTQLGVGIKTETVNYRYSIQATKNAVFNYAVSRPGAYRYRRECFGIFCSNVKEPLKSYVGAVFAVPASNLDPKADKKEMLTVAIACEALRPGTTQPAKPTIQKSKVACGEGTRDLSVIK